MAKRAGALVLAAVTITSATLAGAVTVQQGDLRITVLAQVEPYKLPRDKPAPIAVFIAGHLENKKGGIPPQLQEMTVEVNRHGLLQSRGLPVCRASQLEAASSSRALANCKGALIGSGQFWAHIVLPDQGAYPTRGRLLIFNGRERARPTLLAHIYTANPFNSSFTVAFSIRHISKGRYGTRLRASLPEALGSWGYLDRIKLTLKREYAVGGKTLSYFNASCPAPEGATRAPFSLAHATLSFDTTAISANVVKSCGVKQ